jgi:hypothetical protein
VTAYRHEEYPDDMGGPVDDDDPGPLLCPACGADNRYGCLLGTLGRLEWFRCRGCGTEHYVTREK